MASHASFCHVFLSFRGEIRDKFTCFLYEALKAQGFVAFMDKSDIRVGDEVDLTIKEGIKNSMSAIIIFSQNYAYSTWCLDELVLIIERKKNSRYFIIPIFYEVEIGDIKHQLGNYGLALEKHRTRHSGKIEKWREALVEVGNILGDHVEGLQGTFIQKMIELFREKLAAKFPECRLPEFRLPTSKPFANDKLVVYTADVTHGRFANTLIKVFLYNNNVAYEKRNCSKDSKYVKELLELVDDDKMINFPIVIVNGRDFDGEEEIDEGLEDFEVRMKLKSALYFGACFTKVWFANLCRKHERLYERKLFNYRLGIEAYIIVGQLGTQFCYLVGHLQTTHAATSFHSLWQNTLRRTASIT